MRLDYSSLFSAYDDIQSEKRRRSAVQSVPRNSLQEYLHKSSEAKTGSGFQRMQKCREALEALDRQGWQRSFHQRLFHDNFIRACARIFWKTEKPGAFARDHQKILEMNGWDHLSQEILVSTPRRYLESAFGRRLSFPLRKFLLFNACLTDSIPLFLLL